MIKCLQCRLRQKGKCLLKMYGELKMCLADTSVKRKDYLQYRAIEKLFS